MLKVDGRTAALEKTAALAFDGGDQAKVVERRRMQTPRQAMNIVRDVDKLALVSSSPCRHLAGPGSATFFSVPAVIATAAIRCVRSSCNSLASRLRSSSCAVINRALSDSSS